MSKNKVKLDFDNERFIGGIFNLLLDNVSACKTEITHRIALKCCFE